MKYSSVFAASIVSGLIAISGSSVYGQSSVAPSAAVALAGTQIEIELGETVSTKTHAIGARFAIRLAAPVVVDGREMLPAGIVGEGEVIDSKKGGMGGRPGKLVLAARFLRMNATQVPLRGLRMAGGGADRSSASVMLAAVPYVGLASLLVSGGDVVIPAGGRASARLAQSYPLAASLPLDENVKSPQQ